MPDAQDRNAGSEASTEPQIALLKDLVNLLLDGAAFFVGDSARAEAARASLRKKKDPDDRQFFANLHEDLKRAQELFSGIPDAWTDGQGSGQQAILQVLKVVQEQYVDDETSDDEDEDEEEDQHKPKQPFALLRCLVFEYNALKAPKDAQNHEEHRIAWLCHRVKFEKTKTKSRNALLNSLQQCCQALKSASTAAPVDTSFRPADPTTTLASTELFTNAEMFHKSVLKHWTCDCFEDGSCLHQNASFSFDNLADANDDRSCGAMLFQTEAEARTIWKAARYQFKPGSSRRALPNALCTALDSCNQHTLIRINDGVPSVVNRQADDQTGGSNALDTTYQEKPLTSCFHLEPGHAVFRLSQKRRMILALYLVYAYRDLGGGCWWPYSRKTSVLLPNAFDTGPLTIFFVASVIKHNIDDGFEFWYNNQTMPSLVALGQLLLSLYLSRHVEITQIKQQLEECSENLMATEITKAVRTCLMFDKAGLPGNTPSTIRSDDMLRARFEQDVIIPIQEVLYHGFKVRVQEIFAPPSPPKLLEIVTPRRKRPSTPGATVEAVPEGYCLHDGHGPELLDAIHAQGADAYMKQLQGCIDQTLNRLPSAPRGSKRAVKVAVLDTGVDIPQQQANDLYGGRICESRTWLVTQNPHGEALYDDAGTHLHPPDMNGHGTHGVSVLLEATRDTDVEIYVAQVFKAASEKVADEVPRSTSKRVADAIKYAVDVWDVDIISMSFGFTKNVSEIEKTIDYAFDKRKLMICAASNCGSNDKRTWPARDSRVLCIYASDGYGNKYFRNPDPVEDEPNYATLGCAVEALWPSPGCEAVRRRKSGTSTATPIAAAIAALVISSMRQCEEEYVQTTKTARSIDEMRSEHRWRTSQLGRPREMSKVFRLMMGDRGARDGFKYITPWTLFRQGRSAQSLAQTILYED